MTGTGFWKTNNSLVFETVQPRRVLLNVRILLPKAAAAGFTNPAGETMGAGDQVAVGKVGENPLSVNVLASLQTVSETPPELTTGDKFTVTVVVDAPVHPPPASYEYVIVFTPMEACDGSNWLPVTPGPPKTPPEGMAVSVTTLS